MRQKRERGDDCDNYLGPTDRTDVRPLQRILDGDETFHCEGDRQPNAHRGAHRTDVHDKLAPTVPIEHFEDVIVAAEDEKDDKDETEIGDRQRGQIVT